MQLYVSLPRNDIELARAAAGAGADAIKLHMNVHHEASGTHFGSFDEEYETLRAIISAVACPVGLMPGADLGTLPSRQQLESLQRSGLNFLDVYSHHMPLWFIDLPLNLILALRRFDGFVEGPYYQTHFIWPPETNRNRFMMCEASIFDAEDIGQPFSFADFRRLRILQEYVDIPLLVPTQKAITPEDAVWLKRTGTGGLMIGAVVTGDTAQSVARSTAAYRAAIDKG